MNTRTEILERYSRVRCGPKKALSGPFSVSTMLLCDAQKILFNMPFRNLYSRQLNSTFLMLRRPSCRRCCNRPVTLIFVECCTADRTLRKHPDLVRTGNEMRRYNQKETKYFVLLLHCSCYILDFYISYFRPHLAVVGVQIEGETRQQVILPIDILQSEIRGWHAGLFRGDQKTDNYHPSKIYIFIFFQITKSHLPALPSTFASDRKYSADMEHIVVGFRYRSVDRQSDRCDRQQPQHLIDNGKLFLINIIYQSSRRRRPLSLKISSYIHRKLRAAHTCFNKTVRSQ